MLPTVPETTRNHSEFAQAFALMSRLGGSLAGSGALAALAVCCLVFATGMNPPEFAASRAIRTTPSAMEAVQQAPQSVPEVKQIRWIRNIVDEPMQLRRGTHDPFGSVSPLGVELPLMAC
ncbi:MAG: hypothetical protein ACOYK7_05170 [Pirellulales bacterium]